MIHAEVIPNHITDATTEAIYDTVTPAPIVTAMTYHTGDLHHIEAYQPTPENVACPDHMPHINPVSTPSKSSSRSSRMTVKPQDKSNKRVITDNPQSDFHSSDDTSSNSEDDLT